MLITGPTGAGKTTTLNYLVDLINSERRCKIVTIEDPIEFVHQNKRAIVVQQEVLTDAHSFNRALIHVLRQDPDVIVVGEMRDHEAIATALTAAETGHLVLATMHSPNVSHAMERIIGVFEGNAQRQIILQLANALQGIISQDLLPAADRTRRVLACEMLVANGAVRNIIRENQLHQLENILQTGTEGRHGSDGQLPLRSLLQVPHHLRHRSEPRATSGPDGSPKISMSSPRKLQWVPGSLAALFHAFRRRGARPRTGRGPSRVVTPESGGTSPTSPPINIIVGDSDDLSLRKRFACAGRGTKRILP